jgi:hypothetical protein
MTLADLKRLALADSANDAAAMLRALAKNDLVKNAPLAVFTLVKAAAELDERNKRVLAMLAVIEAAKALSTACESIGHGASENINDQGGCPVCVRVFEFAAALAKLEQQI